MAGCRYKIFDTKNEALAFQGNVASVINGSPDGDPYQSVPLYDKDLDKYAIRLVWNYEEEIVSIIGKAQWDNAPRLEVDGDFYKKEIKE
jgi:hypothetical protein